MELWIRSQDKELLLKVDLVSVDAVIEEDGEYDIRFHNIVLGRYENKKRALEIFDEIQYFINDIADNKMVGCVYEMPEE